MARKNEVYFAYCPVCKAVYSGLPEERQGDFYIYSFMDSHQLSFFKLEKTTRCVEFEGEIPENMKRAVVYIYSLQGKSYLEIPEILNRQEKFEKVLGEMEELEKATPPPPPRAEPNLFLLVKTQRTPVSSMAVEKIDNGEQEECRDILLLDAVINALNKLPQHIKLDNDFWNCKRPIPRRYMISAYYDATRREAEIIDIQSWSIKKKSPGKWSYREGYWAPIAAKEITGTLKQHINTLVRNLA